jgi:hypothetical protein
MNEDEICGACSKYVSEEKYIHISGLDSVERRNLEDVLQ